METDFIAVIISSLLAFGAFFVLISGFNDDDDDQDGKGTASPVISVDYATNAI